MSVFVSSHLYIRGSKEDIDDFLSALPTSKKRLESLFFEKLTGSNKFLNTEFEVDGFQHHEDYIYFSYFIY